MAFLMRSSKFKTHPKILQETKNWLEKHLAGLTAESKLTKIIVLNEVLQNIYRHTYSLENNKDIDISFSYDNQNRLSFLIHDHGQPVNLPDKKIKGSVDGGFGMKIIYENSEHFSITPSDTGNTTKVIFPKEHNIC